MVRATSWDDRVPSSGLWLTGPTSARVQGIPVLSRIYLQSRVVAIPDTAEPNASAITSDYVVGWTEDQNADPAFLTEAWRQKDCALHGGVYGTNAMHSNEVLTASGKIAWEGG